MSKVAKSLFTFAFVVCASLAFVACSSNSGGGTAETTNSETAVAATVNGKSIMLKDVDRLLSQQAQGQQAQLSQLQLAAARLQVLQGLVQREVMFQRAEREKLLPTEEELTQALASQKQQARMTEEEYQRALKENGQTEGGLREELRRDTAIRKLQEKLIGRITISDREVEDFYNTNKEQFVATRGVQLAAIVFDPNPNEGVKQDVKSEPEAKQKADITYQRLKSGADFATVAREVSEDVNTLLRGGDLGFFTEEQLKQINTPPELSARFFNSMQAGDITEPVNVNGRYYIFKLQGKRLQNENLTLDSPGVRDQIKQTLIGQRQELLNAALVESSMNEAKIVNNLAQNMLNSPQNLSGLRPAANPAASPNASPAAASSPAGGATPTATPAATASPAR
ncbi:MAG: SurA N-terminal domain-containing protein [Pyrinomonadaceae bacterium]|nr:SurA N-terminal domain-containing protein [Pyrinomonadaceae bacterium]